MAQKQTSRGEWMRRAQQVAHAEYTPKQKFGNKNPNEINTKEDKSLMLEPLVVILHI